MKQKRITVKCGQCGTTAIQMAPLSTEGKPIISACNCGSMPEVKGQRQVWQQ